MSVSIDALRKMDKRHAVYLIASELKRRTESNALSKFYPDTGPLAREKYVKHLKMFAAGVEHDERCCLGGNRVGKTTGIGGYETAVHLTGLYPPWWEGYRFKKKMLCWAAGTKGVKTRDTNQKILVGDIRTIRGVSQAGGGLIPAARIVRFTRKSGIADAIDQIVVRHVNGYENVLTFKSYEEGRSSFESEAVDWIWLDEEPPLPIYDECKMRLLTTRGRMLATFTPVEGVTETVLSVLQDSDLL